MSIFTGLSAFPLTPLRNNELDSSAFIRIISMLAQSQVDSITVLGSTGSYAYLSVAQRAHVAQLALEHCGDKPVFVGVGALNAYDVLRNIDWAQEAGAAGLLLAPMCYQPLKDTEVFELYRSASEHTHLPIILYDNPGTTHFQFTPELYRDIAELPHIASIKLPGVPEDSQAARQHIDTIRTLIPGQVTLGISTDSHAARGLNAGCDIWYSVMAGTIPDTAHALAYAHSEERIKKSHDLTPLWELFDEHSSLRVITAIAQYKGLVSPACLPLPLQDMTAHDYAKVADMARNLGL
ncbi:MULTISPECIES: dihydrodipicolinate synthase family protein [unclassified Corynebacterium]|uniref:dihydrodipicolinate synthase family protein n=1 Tax=unclassified Corynebacterium TaxID=2624378 RepID=UPI00163D7AC0|nr:MULTISPECIES: dihydrodipicolinate synthase family protein [unclassified Corynebacterium]